MANNSNVKANLDGLNSILKGLNDDAVLRVGIIGQKAKAEHDSESGLTNADIGTFHELGTSKMPQRSFLERPLKERLNFNNSEMAEMKKVLFKQFFVKGAPEEFFKDLGAKALDVINAAFETNGFGEWKSLTDSTVNRRASKIKGKAKQEEFKHLHNILTDTGTMRRSIDFKVIKK